MFKMWWDVKQLCVTKQDLVCRYNLKFLLNNITEYYKVMHKN